MKIEHCESIEQNLMMCATLRGTHGLPNRTIKEFSWFVSTLLYREYKSPDFFDYALNDVSLKQWDALHKKLQNMKTVSFLQWSQLFLEYCILAYGKDYIEEQEELSALIDELKLKSKYIPARTKTRKAF